jgi:TPR repeat protein
MARFELADVDGATLARLNANGVNANGEGLFELGMMYASGRSVPADLVSAHKWFNLAAQKGHADAARMRREIAAEMTDSEIGQAQRAARDWLKSHAVMAPAPQLRAAA